MSFIAAKRKTWHLDPGGHVLKKAAMKDVTPSVLQAHQDSADVLAVEDAGAGGDHVGEPDLL